MRWKERLSEKRRSKRERECTNISKKGAAFAPRARLLTCILSLMLAQSDVPNDICKPSLFEAPPGTRRREQGNACVQVIAAARQAFFFRKKKQIVAPPLKKKRTSSATKAFPAAVLRGDISLCANGQGAKESRGR